MNVIEATNQALELNTGFYRKDLIIGDSIVCIIPVKEPFWCLMIVMPTKYLNHRPKSDKEWKEIQLCGGWNPTAEDILSDEWKIMNRSDLSDLMANGEKWQESWWGEISQ